MWNDRGGYRVYHTMPRIGDIEPHSAPLSKPPSNQELTVN